MMYRIVLISLFFPLFSISAAADELLSPAAYFKEPAFRHLQVSPNGRYLAMVGDMPLNVEKILKESEDSALIATPTNRTGGHQLVIFDLDERRVVDAANFSNNSIYWLHWATDDRLLISISTSFNLEFRDQLIFTLPASRTISLNWRTKENVLLFANDRAVIRQNLTLSRIVDPLPNDPNHVLMAAYRNGDLDLWRVNIISGDSKRIETGSPRTFGWITNGNGDAAFRLDKNTNGTVMRVFARKPKRGWRLVVTTRMNAKGEAPEFWPIAKGQNQNEMFVLATPRDEETATIKLYDLASGEFTSTVASIDNLDLGGGLLDPNTGEYLGAWYIDNRYKVILRDQTLQKHVDAVNAFFEHDANVELIAASKGQSRIIFEINSPTISGDVYLYDYVARRLDPLFAARPMLQETTLANVEIVNYQTRDGLNITGYLTTPSNIDANEPAPLIMMPHGGPATRDYYQYDPYSQFLASRGYRVFQPNFRGSSGYGRTFLESGYGEWGGAMQDDLTDGLNHLKSRGIVTENRTCILGGSYGGYAALFAAMSASDDYACAVSFAGVTDLIDIVEYAKNKTTGSKDAYELAVQQIGDPRKNAELLADRSPARNAEKFSIPILLIHGKLDSVVPFEQARKLMDALDASDISYENYIVNDGHQFSQLGSTVQSMRRIERFLADHIGAD